MGIEFNAAAFLLSAKSNGACFRTTVTLGRQELFLESAALKALKTSTRKPSEWPAFISAIGNGPFADRFFSFLGAEILSTIDASDYEGATILHDMNTPVGEDLKGRFDAVVDCGSLEHIFNFPTAIKNCMQMLKPRGRLFVVTPANNYCGHGFYQFSPDLFFRTLSPENGFRVERLIVSERKAGSRWFSAPDPAKLRRRVEFISMRQADLLIEASKISDLEPLANAPQQSDYSIIWSGDTSPHSRCGENRSGAIKEYLKQAEARAPALSFLFNPLRAQRAKREELDRALRPFERAPFIETSHDW